jgi:hypothetical protein
LDSTRPRLKKALADGRAARIQTIFFAAIRVIAFGLLLGFVLLVLDTGQVLNGWIAGLLMGVCLLSIVRTARLIWFLKKLLLTASREDAGKHSSGELASAMN